MKSEEEEELVLTEKDESDILLLCEIARANGAALPLAEVIRLTSLKATESQIEKAWKNSQLLFESKFTLVSGLVLEKKWSSQSALEQDKKRRERAKEKLELSHVLVPFLSGQNTRSILVSGSTSYLSVSESDDLDFFTITKKDSVWLFLTRSLLILRIRSLSSRNLDVCLGYSAEEDYVLSEFLSSRSGLFARDALTALPVAGQEFYDLILERARWMEDIFPKAYHARLSGSKRKFDEKTHSSKSPPATNIPRKIANMFLYLVVGNYIKLKAAMLNRKFSKKREYDRIFKLRIGIGHCIYEARSYEELRKLYSKGGPDSVSL